MLRLHSLQDLRSLPLTKWNIRQPPITDEREDAMDSKHNQKFTFFIKHISNDLIQT